MTREKNPPPLFRTTSRPAPDGKSFISTHADGSPLVHLHPGQVKAFFSEERFVLILSGAQSGKTALGPPWLLREMKDKGPGNYVVVAPTFRLLAKQAIPTLVRFFSTLLNLGHLQSSSNEFKISEEGHERIWPGTPFEITRIVFGYAENPDSLESLTAKAAWLDECGARAFRQESHEAIQSRVAIHQGRILYTSTPYVHNWLKYEVFDRAERNRHWRNECEQAKIENREPLPPNPADAGYDSISYESRMNPVFSQEEWDRQKLILPAWRFNMRYRGMFTRPAGAIYDCFDEDIHVKPKAEYIWETDENDKITNVRTKWKLHCGIDFGAPNFYAVFLAEEPGTKKVIAIAEYKPMESKTAVEHITAMKKITGGIIPDYCVGGSKSEGQWRTEFGSHGWPIMEPDQPDVEVGIGRVWAAFKEERLFISEVCDNLIDGVLAYSRPVDESGNPTEGIEDKNEAHECDGLRYIVGWENRKGIGSFIRII